MYAVDTSAAVPSLYDDHEFFARVAPLVVQRRPVLAGHAAFETFAVVTRLPTKKLAPAQAATVLQNNFGDPCWVTVEGTARVYRLIGEYGLAGGAVYDALVAQAALDNGRTLMTLDYRARRVYDLVGVDYEFIP